MTARKEIIRKVGEHFAAAGKYMTMTEYNGSNPPVPLNIIRRQELAYSRLPSLIRKMFPEIAAAIEAGPPKVEEPTVKEATPVKK